MAVKYDPKRGFIFAPTPKPTDREILFALADAVDAIWKHLDREDRSLQILANAMGTADAKHGEFVTMMRARLEGNTDALYSALLAEHERADRLEARIAKLEKERRNGN